MSNPEMIQKSRNDYIAKDNKYKVVVVGVSTEGLSGLFWLVQIKMAAVKPDYVLPLVEIGLLLRKLESER